MMKSYMTVCTAPMWTKQCNAVICNTLLTQTCLETALKVLFSMELPYLYLDRSVCIKTERTLIIALQKKKINQTNPEKSPTLSKNPA